MDSEFQQHTARASWSLFITGPKTNGPWQLFVDLVHRAGAAGIAPRLAASAVPLTSLADSPRAANEEGEWKNGSKLRHIRFKPAYGFPAVRTQVSCIMSLSLSFLTLPY